MMQEEEKGVAGGEEGTLGLGRLPGAQVVDGGGRRESSSQAPGSPTPPEIWVLSSRKPPV